MGSQFAIRLGLRLKVSVRCTWAASPQPRPDPRQCCPLRLPMPTIELTDLQKAMKKSTSTSMAFRLLTRVRTTISCGMRFGDFHHADAATVQTVTQAIELAWLASPSPAL